MYLHKLRRYLIKKYIIFIRLYNSEWICSYKSNLVGFKKGYFICHFKKIEDAEIYALNRTNNLTHGKPRLSFRKSNFFDYIIRS